MMVISEVVPQSFLSSKEWDGGLLVENLILVFLPDQKFGKIKGYKGRQQNVLSEISGAATNDYSDD